MIWHEHNDEHTASANAGGPLPCVALRPRVVEGEAASAALAVMGWT